MGAMLGRLLHNVLVLGSVDHWVNYTFSSSSDYREDEAGSSMHTFYAVDRQQTLQYCTDTLTEDRPGAEDGEDVYEPTIDLTIVEEEEEDRAEETQEVQEDHIPSVDDVLTCSNQRPLPDITFADESEGKPTLPPRNRRRRKAASLHMTEVQQRGCALRRVSTGELHRRMSIEGRCDSAIRTVTTTDGTTHHVRRVRLSLTPFSTPASDIDAQDAMAIETMTLDVDIPIPETLESTSRSSSRASTTRPESTTGPLQGAVHREGMCRRVTVSVDAAADGGQPDQVNVDVMETKQAALAPETEHIGEMVPEAPVVQCTSDLEAALLRLMTQTARDPDNPAIVTHRRDIHLITAYLANTLGLRDSGISLPMSAPALRTPPPSLPSRMDTASPSPVGTPSQRVDSSMSTTGAGQVDTREDRSVNTTDNVCGELSEDMQGCSLPSFVANNVTENCLSSPSPVAGVIDPMCVDHNENNMVHSSAAETHVDNDNSSNVIAAAETTATPVAVARSRKGRRKLRYSALHELPDDVLSPSVALAEEDEVVRDLWSVPCSTGAGQSSRPSPALDFFE